MRDEGWVREDLKEMRDRGVRDLKNWGKNGEEEALFRV